MYSRTATECRPYRNGAPHDFDSNSGWCVHGCGNRDDGRIITRQAEVIHPGPTYQTQLGAS